MTDLSPSDPTGYCYLSDAPDHTHAYLWGQVQSVLQKEMVKSLFELGCGNGAFAFELAKQGLNIVGVDPSDDGIRHAQARKTPEGNRPTLVNGNAYDDLAAKFGTFPCVVSLEVVEHVYFPRKFSKCVHDLLQPGGIAVLSTPYHGYLKNLALAITGKLDGHFTALWDHGHIKFWSVKTLSQLLGEAGLIVEEVHYAGRFSWLAKSMIVVARRPR
jgi:2-polyprenyl-3-methyl-5-hydroxy-6-metoxy-1,4-benzoquinol methylase